MYEFIKFMFMKKYLFGENRVLCKEGDKEVTAASASMPASGSDVAEAGKVEGAAKAEGTAKPEGAAKATAGQVEGKATVSQAEAAPKSAEMLQADRERLAKAIEKVQSKMFERLSEKFKGLARDIPSDEKTFVEVFGSASEHAALESDNEMWEGIVIDASLSAAKNAFERNHALAMAYTFEVGNKLKAQKAFEVKPGVKKQFLISYDAAKGGVIVDVKEVVDDKKPDDKGSKPDDKGKEPPKQKTQEELAKEKKFKEDLAEVNQSSAVVGFLKFFGVGVPTKKGPAGGGPENETDDAFAVRQQKAIEAGVKGDNFIVNFILGLCGFKCGKKAVDGLKSAFTRTGHENCADAVMKVEEMVQGWVGSPDKKDGSTDAATDKLEAKKGVLAEVENKGEVKVSDNGLKFVDAERVDGSRDLAIFIPKNGYVQFPKAVSMFEKKALVKDYKPGDKLEATNDSRTVFLQASSEIPASSVFGHGVVYRYVEKGEFTNTETAKA